MAKRNVKVYQLYFFEQGRKKESSDDTWGYSIDEARGDACKLIIERRIASIESISKVLKKKYKHPVPGNARYVEIAREADLPNERNEVAVKSIGAVFFIPNRGFWWGTERGNNVVFYPITPKGRIKGKPVRRLI